MANISMNVDQELTTIFNVSLVIELLKDQYDIDITDEYALELLGISPQSMGRTDITYDVT